MTNITNRDARDLDLNLLRVFAVVAEEGSITRAAQRLYVTQPAVSASMRRLKEFVGTELISRQGKQLVLTTRGKELQHATRMYLQPLLDASQDHAAFDALRSEATFRIGLADALESLILPNLLRQMAIEAPQMRLAVLPVQFRSVEEMLISGKVDLAVTVADALPKSIMRAPLRAGTPKAFAVVWDSRHLRIKKLDAKTYLAHEHVIVSYAGDFRGIIEDALGKTRKVRVSVPSFGHVPDLVDGSSLLATVPNPFAQHMQRMRPHLKSAPLPFTLPGATLELLWPRALNADAATTFMRGLLTRC